MTIRMLIKNEDTRNAAVVVVDSRNPETLEQVPGGQTNMLHGGEECHIYVHSGQSVLVREVKNG